MPSQIITIGIALLGNSLAAAPANAETMVTDSEFAVHRLEVNGNRISIGVPAEWFKLPQDPGYFYLSSLDGRKKVTFYAQLARGGETPEARCRIALRNLRTLQQAGVKGVNRRSSLAEISAGPVLNLANDLPNASWMYRVIRNDKPEIRYWTVVTRRRNLMCYLEFRWEPMDKEDGTLSLPRKFCQAFQPICQSLRFDDENSPLPIQLLSVSVEKPPHASR
jgi:hypothetical protein